MRRNALYFWRRPALVMVIALAACGGDDDDGGPGDGPGPMYRDEHPRVFLTEANVARLKALVADGDPAAERFLDTVEARESVYDYRPWYTALASHVLDDSALCDDAVADVDTWVREEEARIAGGERAEVSADSYLHVGQVLADVLLVYDWCAPMVSDGQRDRWLAYAHQSVWNVWNHEEATWGSASFPWSGWSVDNPVNNYYYSFLRATMLLGLVGRGEHPDAEGWLTKFREDKIREQLVPTFREDLEGGGSREGTGYGTAMAELFRIYDFWEASTGEKLSDDSTHAYESMAYLIHATVPTLDFLAPIGDHSRDASAALYDYHRGYMLALTWLHRDDPLAAVGRRWLGVNSVPEMSQRSNAVLDFLYRDPDGEVGELDELATAYFGPGTGHAFARSDWSEDATWVGFVAGPYTESHAHRDQLSILLYRGEWLAYDPNTVSASGLHIEEDAHNLVRLERGGTTVAMREGRSSELLAVADRPLYFYAAADAASVFDDGADVNRLQREIVFVRPDVLIVYDRVDAGGSTDAVWQLSTPESPSTAPGVTTAGNMVVHHLIPAVTAQVGGWPSIDGDMSSGSRIDVTSTGPSEFLHVLSVDGAVDSVALASTATHDGVTVSLATGGSITARFHRTQAGGSIRIDAPGGDVPVNEELPDTVTRPPLFAE